MTPRLVIHVPHASTFIPSELKAEFLLDDHALESEVAESADLWTDRLSAGMMVLNVTTSEQTQAKMMDLALETSEGRGNSYLLFRTAAQFGRYFKPAKPMTELLEGEWVRAGKPGFRIDLA